MKPAKIEYKREGVYKKIAIGAQRITKTMFSIKILLFERTFNEFSMCFVLRERYLKENKG